MSDLLNMAEAGVKNVVMYYQNQKHFEQLARSFGIMGEWKAGVPRASYQVSGLLSAAAAAAAASAAAV